MTQQPPEIAELIAALDDAILLWERVESAREAVRAKRWVEAVPFGQEPQGCPTPGACSSPMVEAVPEIERTVAIVLLRLVQAAFPEARFDDVDLTPIIRAAEAQEEPPVSQPGGSDEGAFLAWQMERGTCLPAAAAAGDALAARLAERGREVERLNRELFGHAQIASLIEELFAPETGEYVVAELLRDAKAERDAALRRVQELESLLIAWRSRPANDRQAAFARVCEVADALVGEVES